MPSADPPPGKWLVFVLVAVGIFMSTLDGSIVNVALPTIMSDLSANLSTVEWVMMIYLLTVSSLLLSFGRLSDIKGRRWVYSRGLLVFSAGSLLCGTARTALWLIGARAFQGVGAAMIMACTPALVADTFPAEERGRALGMVGAVVASGLTLGPALGGWILDLFSWQVIFYINIPIGLATGLLVSRILKGGPADISRPEAFDWAGAVLMVLCFGPLLLALTHAYEWGYAGPATLGLTGLSLASLVGLAIVETRTPQPLVAPGILAIRRFTLPLISAMILFAGLFTMVFLMPFFLMHPAGFSVARTGYFMVAPFGVLFLISPLSGTLSDRIGSRLLCTLGMAVLAAALLLLAQLTPGASAFSIAARMALAGVGTAVFIAPNTSTIMGAVPPKRVGVAAATVAAARNLGMVLGIAMAGTIFNTVFHHLSGGDHFSGYEPGMAETFMAAFSSAMSAGAAVALAGVGISYLRGAEEEDGETTSSPGGPPPAPS